MATIRITIPNPMIPGSSTQHPECTDDPQIALACARDMLGDGAAEVACPNPSCWPEGEDGPEADAHLVAVNVIIPDDPSLTSIRCQ